MAIPTKHVPFFANRKDDLHCFQASLKIILKYFLPKRTFSLRRLEQMTGFKKRFWTWPIKGMLALQDMGFEVLIVEVFDYKQFTQEPKGYLRREYGEKVADAQTLHSDVTQASIDAKEVIRKVVIQKRIPTFDDLHALLGDRWLLICLVNARTLNRKKGYVGHFVVVWKCTEKTVYLHDPGLPPRKNRRVTRRVFEEAWADPNEKAKGIMAFRI